MRQVLNSDAEFALLVEAGQFVLAEAAPDAIGLTHGERMFQAHLAYRALGADGLCAIGAYDAGSAPLTFGVEEDGGVLAPAGAMHLPVPMVGICAGKPGELCHDDPFFLLYTLR